MDNIINEQRWFLYNSIVFIIILTSLSMLVIMLIVRRVAVTPLRLLRRGASAFTERKNSGSEAGKYTMDDVMELNIKNRDEIGDLYREIRDMQISIVNDTQELTTITAEQERIRTELDLAARIQSGALPAIEPDFSIRSEFTLGTSMTQAKEVGGDFYDFFKLGDDRIALVIADVSGKGIPAALFMMTAKLRIGSRAQAGGTPAEILRDVNLQLCEKNPTKMFVTVWLGFLDLKTGILTSCNAGHEMPVLRSGGSQFELVQEEHSLVLGGLKNTLYSDHELVIKPGDALFVYTDGITEARNSENRFYGTDRLLSALKAAASTEPGELIGTVKNDIAAQSYIQTC